LSFFVIDKDEVFDPTHRDHQRSEPFDTTLQLNTRFS
jgi:hypothetical protein